MVHALREIWRVLAPGGRLVEFRPLGASWPLDVIAGETERPIGRVDRKPDIRNDATCEAALAHARGEGWFIRERQETFETSFVWETLAEVSAPVVLTEAVTARAERLVAEAGPGARVRIRFKNVIARYRKVFPAAPVCSATPPA